MRIHDAYTKLVRPQDAAGTAAGRGPEAAGGSAAGRAAPEDAPPAAGAATRVSVSGRAQTLAAEHAPSSAKVAALREEIGNGTFRIDAGAIAARLIGDDA